MAKHTEVLTVNDMANDVTEWLLHEAEPDEIRSFVAEWRGIRIEDVTVDDHDEITIAPTQEVRYPTPEVALALKDALRNLFEHCVMIHKHWGEGNNVKEADAAIEAARASLLNVGITV